MFGYVYLNIFLIYLIYFLRLYSTQFAYWQVINKAPFHYVIVIEEWDENDANWRDKYKVHDGEKPSKHKGVSPNSKGIINTVNIKPDSI